MLLQTDSEDYVGSDPIGARMWEALADTHDIEAVVAQLVDELEVGNGLVDRSTPTGDRRGGSLPGGGDLIRDCSSGRASD